MEQIFDNDNDVLDINPDGSLNTRDQYSQAYTPSFFAHINPIYGDEMAQDAAFSGTPDVIYKEDVGTPTEWDTSGIIGIWDFASTAIPPHTGTFCIDATNTVNGDICHLENGGNISGYVAYTGFIYLETWSEVKNNHLNLYGWETTGGTMVGNTVNVEDYIDTGLFGEWQKFTISVADLGITDSVIDAFRFEVHADIGAPNAPNFYLDTMQLEETGGGISYVMEFPTNLWFWATHFRVVWNGPSDGLTGIDGTKFYNIEALTNGLSNIITAGGVDLQGIILRSINDAHQVPEGEFEFFTTGSTGTSQIIYTIKWDKPLLFRGDLGDKSTLTINDELSDMGSFKATMGGLIEFV